MANDIDLIIPMVFPQDPMWQREYAKHNGGGEATKHVRFRSWGTEELLVRCCMKYMPWLHHIYILLARESQVQPWMDRIKNEELRIKNGPQMRLVFHREFIPAHLLPTFNICTIEMFLHKIPGLSEHFIYSNDDFFPLSPLEADDFFRPAGDATGTVALLPCQHHNEKPYPTQPNIFHKFVMNGLNMVAADFGKHYTTTWLRGCHSMQPMLRSTVEKVCTLHADRIAKSFTFARRPENFNQYIFPFYQHFTGEYVNHRPRQAYVGPKVPTNRIAEYIRRPDAGIVCLNDNDSIADWQERAAIVRQEISKKIQNN